MWNTLYNRTVNNQTNMYIVLLSLTVALFRSFFFPFFGMWLSLSSVWRYDKTGSLKKRFETNFTDHSSLEDSITHDKKTIKKIQKIGRTFQLCVLFIMIIIVIVIHCLVIRLINCDRIVTITARTHICPVGILGYTVTTIVTLVFAFTR